MGSKTAVSSVLAVAALAAGGWATTGHHLSAEDSAPEPVAVSADAGLGANEVPSELLDGLSVVDELPDVDGYERSCSKGKACSFGPAWTDDTSAPGAHNGCDTRNDVLASQARDVRTKPGSHGCKVTGGTLDEPYAGASVDLATSKSKVQIDHVYPLARAWDAGASTWSPDQRAAFANDVDRNLLAVDGKANNTKSDKGLDEWVPPNAAFDCAYAKRYLDVARTYGLAVTTADGATAEKVCHQ